MMSYSSPQHKVLSDARRDYAAQILQAEGVLAQMKSSFVPEPVGEADQVSLARYYREQIQRNSSYLRQLVALQQKLEDKELDPTDPDFTQAEQAKFATAETVNRLLEQTRDFQTRLSSIEFKTQVTRAGTRASDMPLSSSQLQSDCAQIQAQASKTREHIVESLQDEMVRLNQRQQQLEETSREQRVKTQELQLKAAQKDNQLRQAQQTAQQLKARVMELETQLQKSLADQREAEAKCKQMQAQDLQNSARLDQTQRLKAETSLLEERLAEAKRQQLEQTQSLQAYIIQTEALQSENKALAQALQTAQIGQRVSRTDQEALQTSLQQTQAQLARQMDQEQAIRQELQQYRQKLNAQLEDLQSQLQAAQAKVRDLQTEAQTARAKALESENRTVQLARENQNLLEQLRKQQQQLDAVQQSEKQHLAALLRLQEEAERAASQEGSVHKRMESLEALNRELVAHKTALERELDSSAQQLEEALRAVQEKQSLADALASKVETAEELITTQQERITSLKKAQKELGETKTQLAVSKATTELRQKQLAEVEERLTILAGEKETLSASLADATRKLEEAASLQLLLHQEKDKLEAAQAEAARARALSQEVSSQDKLIGELNQATRLLQQQISQKQSQAAEEIASLQAELAKANEALAGERCLQKEAELATQKASADLGRRVAEVESLQMELAELRVKLQKANSATVLAQEETCSVRAELQKLQQGSSAQQEDFSEAMEQLREENSQLRKAQETILSGLQQQLKAQLLEASQREGELENELKNLQRQLEVATQEKVQLGRQLNIVTEETEELADKLADHEELLCQNDAFAGEIDTLKKLSREQEQQIAFVQEELDIRTQEIEHYREEIQRQETRHKAELDALANKLKEAGVQRDNAEEAHRELLQEAAHHKALLAQLSQDNASLAATAEAQAQEYGTTATQLAAKLGEKERNLGEKEQRISTLERELETARQKLSGAETQLAVITEAKVTAEAEAATQKERIVELQAALVKQQVSQAEYEGALKMAEQRLADLKNKADTQTQLLEALEKSASAKTEELNAELRRKDVELRDSQETADAWHAEIETMRAKIAQLQMLEKPVQNTTQRDKVTNDLHQMYQTQIQQLQEQAMQQVTASHHAEQAFLRQIRDLEAARADLEEQLRSSGGTLQVISTQRAQLSSQAARISALEKTCGEHLTARKALEVKVSELEAQIDTDGEGEADEIADLKTQLHASELSSVELRRQLQETTQKLRQLEETSASRQYDISRLEEQLAQAVAQKDSISSSLSSQAKEHAAQLQKLQALLEDQQRQLRDRGVGAASLQEAIASQEAQLAMQETQNKRNEAALKVAQDAQVQYRLANEELREKIAIVQEENNRAQQLTQKLQRLLQEAGVENERLVARLADKQASILASQENEKTSAQTKQTDAELNAMRAAQIKDLSEQTQRLQRHLEQTLQENNSLKARLELQQEELAMSNSQVAEIGYLQQRLQEKQAEIQRLSAGAVGVQLTSSQRQQYETQIAQLKQENSKLLTLSHPPELEVQIDSSRFSDRKLQNQNEIMRLEKQRLEQRLAVMEKICAEQQQLLQRSAAKK